MKKNDRVAEGPIWDLPVRLFHWLCVILIGASWWSAEQGADQVHFWSGYALLFLLIFRILWGFAGSSTARFAGFVRGPAAVLAYLRTGRHGVAGHTPLGALSVIAMLLAIAGQIATGLIQIDADDFIEGPLAGLVSYDTATLAHEVHEAGFKVLLGLIALHLLAIAFYRLRGRSLVGAMITGRGALPNGGIPMAPAPRARLIACLIAALVSSAAIVMGGSLAS